MHMEMPGDVEMAEANQSVPATAVPTTSTASASAATASFFGASAAAERSSKEAEHYAAVPARREKGADLAGTVKGMHTWNWGWLRQVQFDLSHHSLCKCKAQGKSATHEAGCEHGLIIAGKKLHGYDNRGKPKKKK